MAADLLATRNELAPARVQAKGSGQWRPVAANDAEEDRAKNRRVEMMITGKDLEDKLSYSVAQYYTTTGREQPGVTDVQTEP